MRLPWKTNKYLHKELIGKGYTATTGALAVPPPWSFGLWMGRITYTSQEQVERLAKDLRAHCIPCDVIHIDTVWYKEEWVCDLRFSPNRFPDPGRMMARLREQGFRVCLWQFPKIVNDDPQWDGELSRSILRNHNQL